MRPARLLPGQRFGQSPEPTAQAGVVSALASFIRGCIASNNGTDPQNDLDISAGGATMVSGDYTVALTAMTKQFDTAWAGGTNQGGAMESAILTGKARAPKNPEVRSYTTNKETAATTLHNVTIPSGMVAGDLLLLLMVVDSNGSITTPGGWTLLNITANSTNMQNAIFYKIAAGTETNFTVTTASAESVNACLAIKYAGTPITTTAATGTSATPDCPSLDSGDATYKLWLALGGFNTGISASAYPSDFTPAASEIVSDVNRIRHTENSGGASGVGIGVATIISATQTIDPASFTIGSSQAWVAHTIAIPNTGVVVGSTQDITVAPSVRCATTSNEDPTATLHDVVIPIGLLAGDLILICLSFDAGDPGAVTASGYTELVAFEDSSGTTYTKTYVFYKTASGSETDFTISSGTARRSANYCFAIKDWGGTPLAATSGNNDPASLDSTLGTGYKKLWFAMVNGGLLTGVSVYPTGFAMHQFTNTAGGNFCFGICAKEDTAQTVDPSAFTVTGANLDCGTITVVIAPYSSAASAFSTDFQVGELIKFVTDAKLARITSVTTNSLMVISEIITTPSGGQDYKRYGGLGDVSTDGGTVHVFALYDPTLGITDYGMSRRAATPVDLPTGYTEYRRIASLKPDANDDLVAMSGMELSGGGVEVLYTTPIEDVDVTDLGAASTTYTLFIPTGHKHHALIHATVEHASARARVNIRPLDVTDQAPSQTATPLSTLISQVNAVDAAVGRMQIRTNTSGQIAARSDQANTLFGVATLGYVDHRRAT
jgi:hypothetical protein